jgi:hypothetical protein
VIEYYYTQIGNFIYPVLEIVTLTFCQVLNKITNFKRNIIQNLENKTKKHLKRYIQLENSINLSLLIQEISVETL